MENRWRRKGGKEEKGLSRMRWRRVGGEGRGGGMDENGWRRRKGGEWFEEERVEGEEERWRRMVEEKEEVGEEEG